MANCFQKIPFRSFLEDLSLSPEAFFVCPKDCSGGYAHT
jgi:hypothetical protein